MNKLSIIGFGLAAMYLGACQSGTKTEEKAAEEAPKAVSLVKKWETDTTLTTAESVYFDATNSVLYVACIGAVPPDAKDGDGFIAKVGLDGTIIDTQWVTGLHGPKGMGMIGNLLYVTNIDEVVEIDVNSGEITNTFKVEGASFLNDITVDASGNIYISDTNTNSIFVLANGATTLWTQGDALGGPNGLLVDNDQLLMATFGAGNFNTISMADKTVQMVVDSLPGGDGVAKLGDDFLVSNWNGEVYHISAEWVKTKILDTKDAGSNAADIEFVAAQNLLLVPTFFGNKVVAYEVLK